MSTKTWKVQPLYAIVSEILDKKGSLNDMELFESLKVFYKDIGFDEFNKTLMRMELSGLISVSSLTKGRRLVQLVKR
ncbi:MAG: hypothetical protein QXX08_02655 [Candidatus Bathyarchaeia archaeon]